MERLLVPSTRRGGEAYMSGETVCTCLFVASYSSYPEGVDMAVGLAGDAAIGHLHPGR